MGDNEAPAAENDNPSIPLLDGPATSVRRDIALLTFTPTSSVCSASTVNTASSVLDDASYDLLLSYVFNLEKKDGPSAASIDCRVDNC